MSPRSRPTAFSTIVCSSVRLTTKLRVCFCGTARTSCAWGMWPAPACFDMQITDSGMAYFVLGSDRVLSRLDKLTDTKQDLHPNVSRFLLRGDEKYAALSLSTAGTSTTVVFDVHSGKDIPLARPNPCCWLGFAGPRPVHLLAKCQRQCARRVSHPGFGERRSTPPGLASPAGRHGASHRATEQRRGPVSRQPGSWRVLRPE
jgi:hypothetical protein